MKPRQRKALLSWYATRRTVNVDIVGDFAGGELFAIHGESLIRYCVEQSKVDFSDGFQLLHAVYAVEKFLSDLQKRGCNFEIIFFQDLAHVCAPEGTAEADHHKHLLTRRIVIQHLKRSPAGIDVHEFVSFENKNFGEYLSSHTLHFVLFHEGQDDHGSGVVDLRHLIWKFHAGGRHVALINFTTWKTSKVFVHLLSGFRSPGTSLNLGQRVVSPSTIPRVDHDISEPVPSAVTSLREWIVIIFCRVYLRRTTRQDADLEQVHALLLHTAALELCSLSERMCEKQAGRDSDRSFLEKFSETSRSLIESRLAESELAWDLYDLVDGRVFLHLLNQVRNRVPINDIIVERARAMWSNVLTEGIQYSADDFNDASEQVALQAGQNSPAEEIPEILPFSHPAFDEFLEGVRANSKAKEHKNSTADNVFRDLHHWHVNKPLVTRRPEKPGFFAKRRHQNQIHSMTKYAESLQNLGGRRLERETITVKPQPSRKQPKKGGKTTPVQEGNRKPPRPGNKKGGRENALGSARECKVMKEKSRQNDIVQYWAQTRDEYRRDPSLVGQYLKAEKFLMDRSKGDRRVLEPDIRIFCCHILTQIWSEVRQGVRRESPKGLYLLSMMWHLILEVNATKSATHNTQNAVGNLSKSFRLPVLKILTTAETVPREQPFDFEQEPAQLPSRLTKDRRLLQLEHGGPYMERQFDSEADGRVPFEPDAWQRRVLDAIDDDESLLVVAPTSAGKTFISFYAMKKVLEESDDAVLVYVAPTKALVNQIAAEVEARFSKSYHGKGGKSVWAIHTRDYRINNPSGCQVLVTVPHILQIMLLSPVNASQPDAWSHRVRRIIFDEVHCIGQAEDGVIWEQLLLLAPCPIVALSATVGNPEEFRDWLRVSQAQKSYSMRMIAHNVRYSDLRKFIYQPPPGEFVFDELAKAPRLPVPGLDEGDNVSLNFKFVHPVLALRDRNRLTLDDVSLEARDCLSLWETMMEMEDAHPTALHERVRGCRPELFLPQLIAKSDVVKWEAALKDVLRDAMDESGDYLKALQNRVNARVQGNPSSPNPAGTAGKKHIDSLFPLVCELHSQDALPALVFNYDRQDCEAAVTAMSQRLAAREKEWKETNPAWQKKLADFASWQKNKAGERPARLPVRTKDRAGDASRSSRLELAQEAGSAEVSPWETFDPDGTLSQFSFADWTKMQNCEFKEAVQGLERKVSHSLIHALRRGLGVHHAGMNKQYRQIVEMMFRRGYLRVVVATGTLALGINMPCKTVIFSGDSVYLTAQNYRQASGRAGRRGFDLLGNVVFNGVPERRVHEIMSSRLPDLRGQFPISTTLVLRLFSLLHGTDNSAFATGAARALMSQTRLYLGGPDAEMSVKHHLRFSIEYLRRQDLLSDQGTPVNFAGMVSHLYFTENAVFAFHSLLRGGYFHKLCVDINRASERVLYEIMLVLSHLFKRIPVHQSRQNRGKPPLSSSIVFLPRLPREAEEMLLKHNEETLSIFKGYVRCFINQHLSDSPDNQLPLTKTTIGTPSTPLSVGSISQHAPTVIRSPFAALSGFGDDFESIRELCSTVRGGVFLEESAIPYIPIWPHDSDAELNAYLLDFYKHGSMSDLVVHNRIKKGDVWFHLKDFSLVLKTIVTSLKSLSDTETDPSADLDDDDDDYDDGQQEQGHAQDDGSTEDGDQKFTSELDRSQRKKTKGKQKQAEVPESWDEDLQDSSSGDEGKTTDTQDAAPQSSSPNTDAMAGRMSDVLKAFEMLEERFELKFKKVWA